MENVEKKNIENQCDNPSIYCMHIFILKTAVNQEQNNSQ